MKKLIEEKNVNRDKKSRGIVGFLVAVLVFLMIFQVVISNRMVETADKLKLLDTQIEKIEKDNFAISQQLRQKGSLAVVEAESKANGFIKQSNISFIKADVKTVAFGKIISLQ